MFHKPDQTSDMKYRHVIQSVITEFIEYLWRFLILLHTTRRPSVFYCFTYVLQIPFYVALSR